MIRTEKWARAVGQATVFLAGIGATCVALWVGEVVGQLGAARCRDPWDGAEPGPTGRDPAGAPGAALSAPRAELLGWLREARDLGPERPDGDPAGADPTVDEPSGGDAALPPPPVGALDEAQLRARLDEVRGDPPPPELLTMHKDRTGQHFTASDEYAPELFEPWVAGLGGVYVGVGSDQGLLYTAWMRADLAWLIDYDDVVVELHRVHLALIAAARSPEDLLLLWGPTGKARALEVLEAHAEDRAQARALTGAYRRNRSRIHQRFERIDRKHRARGVANFLNDPDQLAHLQRLIAQGRLRSLRVDLNGSRGLAGIAQATRDVGLEVTVLYLSNAEQYFLYKPEFRANVRGLPWADRAVVLRTIAAQRRNRDYRYVLQSAASLTALLADPKIRQVYAFVPLGRIPRDSPVLQLVGEPRPALPDGASARAP